MATSQRLATPGFWFGDFCCNFEAGSAVVQAGLEFIIILPPPLQGTRWQVYSLVTCVFTSLCYTLRDSRASVSSALHKAAGA